MQRGDDFAIEFDDTQLMVSWAQRSEQALATLACQRVAMDGGRMLIGGLGMGFTLSAALAVLPESASVVVAELVPKVVEWARGPLAHLFGETLDDPRVAIRIGDVHDVITDPSQQFDVILLDVDNGPEGLISLANDRLYCNWGLRQAFDALRPGGVLAIWSGYVDNAFADRLEDAGFVVEEVRMRTGERGRGERHVIWLATREHWPTEDAESGGGTTPRA